MGFFEDKSKEQRDSEKQFGLGRKEGQSGKVSELGQLIRRPFEDMVPDKLADSGFMARRAGRDAGIRDRQEGRSRKFRRRPRGADSSSYSDSGDYSTPLGRFIGFIFFGTIGIVFFFGPWIGLVWDLWRQWDTLEYKPVACLAYAVAGAIISFPGLLCLTAACEMAHELIAKRKS